MRSIVPIILISPFFPFSHKPNVPQIQFFWLDFEHPFMDCAHLLLCWVLLFLQGVGVDFGGVLQTLDFKGAHQVLDNSPQRISSMPRGQASSSRSSRTHAMVARPPIESRKLILETTFAIKDNFSKNEATKWAVQ
jgi:hypothetical protein